MRITASTDLSSITSVVNSISTGSGGDYDSRQLITTSQTVTVSKGWLYINAAGGGGGGASGAATSVNGGSGGGSGMSCLGAKIWIPSTTTLTITVGTAGGAQTTQAQPGNSGGTTIIAGLPNTNNPSNPFTQWNLYGGQGGTVSSVGIGAYITDGIPTGFAHPSTATTPSGFDALPLNKDAVDYSIWTGGSRGGIWYSARGNAGGTNAQSSAFIWAVPHPIWHDIISYTGSSGAATTAMGGIGGHSLFGKGGNGALYSNAVQLPAEAGSNYGSGGGGGRGGIAGANNYGAAGAPGFVEIWQ